MRTNIRGVFLALSAATCQAWGAAIVDVTAGTVTGSDGFYGESVTTPAGGPWSSIRFNWYTGGGTAFAAGALFILTQEYLGTPAGLSAGTPGFLASSTGISSGEYLFAPGVQLAAGTQYFFYANALLSGILGAASDTYPGGDVYFASDASSNFAFFAASDANFRLSGDAQTPEPGSLLLFGAGAVAIVLRRRM